MATEESTQKLAKLIKGIKIAMLTTVDTDQTLRSRPMATQETEFDGTLWFFNSRGSHKCLEIGKDNRVNVSYAEPSDNRYVSVSGTAQIVEDKAKIAELWTPAMKVWFPKGQEDPDVQLLKVSPTQAEYWDTGSSTLVHIAGFVKAMVTGERPHPGDHAKVDLK